MSTNARTPVNMAGLPLVGVLWKLLLRATVLAFDSRNRAVRREKGLSPFDTLFNFVKLSFLEKTVLKYRHPVKFGEKVILDSTFPPYPSKALDKRLSNYLNHLDMMEIPSGIVAVSTTNTCPYACAFCSTNAGRRADDLDEDLLKNTISEIENLGVPTIILHGGEPMYQYDRFLRIVKHVKNDTCLWMFTTGYGVTAERAKELAENGLFGAWVSLDHYDPAVHNKMRGNSEAFTNAVQAVENFKKAGLYTCLSLVPPEELEDPENFRKYYDFAKELGVAEIRIMEVKPSGREACQGVKPHSDKLARLQIDLHKDPAYRDYPPLSGLSTWLEKDAALGCQCRFEYLFISAAGDVQPCEATEISFGNLKEEKFRDIYQRICKAFPAPGTGCIPMVMYPEVRDYQKSRASLGPEEYSEISANIMEGFRERGHIPGAYQPLWSMYERRVKRYRWRMKKRSS